MTAEMEQSPKPMEIDALVERLPERVNSTVIIGHHGQPVVTRGYWKIGGVRIYDDIAVVDEYGQQRLARGGWEISSLSGGKHG